MQNLNQDTLRSKKTQKAYMDYLENDYDGSCIFCAKDLMVKDYGNFVLLRNRFPYDSIYSDHLLLAPKEHVENMYDLSYERIKEYFEIIDTIKHDHARLNSRDERSIPLHLHIHLLIK